MPKILLLLIKIKQLYCLLRISIGMLICVAITLTITTNVSAQTVNWVGAISTDYGTSANWDAPTFNPVAPVGTEIVVIGGGNLNNPIQIGGNSTKRVAKLNTLPGAQFTVRGTLYPNNSDMLNGSISG